MPSVLVCVADVQLFLLLRHVLANEGFEARLVTRCSEVPGLCVPPPVAAIIDWSEGPLDRIGLLAAVKAAVPSSPVILMSRRIGGSDLITPACNLLLEPPFNPEILLQFLRGLLSRQFAAGHAKMPGAMLRFADIEMNLATVTVHRAGKEVALTALQFRLLRRLLQTPTVVCGREDLIESCWPAHAEVEPRTVDIHIGHIRRALEDAGPDMIRTVRGRGYALCLPPSINLPKPSNS